MQFWSVKIMICCLLYNSIENWWVAGRTNEYRVQVPQQLWTHRVHEPSVCSTCMYVGPDRWDRACEAATPQRVMRQRRLLRAPCPYLFRVPRPSSARLGLLSGPRLRSWLPIPSCRGVTMGKDKGITGRDILRARPRCFIYLSTFSPSKGLSCLSIGARFCPDFYTRLYRAYLASFLEDLHHMVLSCLLVCGFQDTDYIYFSVWTIYPSPSMLFPFSFSSAR